MNLWEWLQIPGDQLGRGTGVRVRIGGDVDALAREMATEMAALIRENNSAEMDTCAIVPVGPVGQYRHLARIIADDGLDCSRVTFVTMDEYLDEKGDLIDIRHPLSFRGFMQREFYDLLPASAGFARRNQLFPDPHDCSAISGQIAARGGVNVCFGGVGLNGHIAFNEPRADLDADVFAELPTRTVTCAPESRAHMAINLSCPVDIIPRRAVTVGMKEILSSRRLSFYANRTWQGGVVRQLLHGPVTPHFPASYLQRHPDAHLTVAGFLAHPVEVLLQ